MLVTHSTVVSRYVMENRLKIGYPCSCHMSPVESESYTIHFDLVNHNDYPRRISKINVMCNTCRQKASFDVADRWIMEYDVSDL